MILEDKELERIKTLVRTYIEIYKNVEILEEKAAQLEEDRKLCLSTLLNIRDEEEKLIKEIANRNKITIKETKEKLITIIVQVNKQVQQ